VSALEWFRAYLGPLRATLSSRSPGNRELHRVFVRPLFPFELLPRRTIARGRKLARRASLEIVGPRSSRCRQRSIDRIAVSLKRISSEKKFVNAAGGGALVANSLSMALDEFANLCAYRCPTKRRRTRRRSLRTETVLRLRSHIVAKAAAALPFIRPCDWSRMSVTEQGPRYLTKPENLGTSRIAGRA
jgi:hypothetical protein